MKAAEWETVAEEASQRRHPGHRSGACLRLENKGEVAEPYSEKGRGFSPLGPEASPRSSWGAQVLLDKPKARSLGVERASYLKW